MENEWWRLLELVKKDRKQVVEDLKNRKLHEAIWFVRLVNNRIGAYSAMYLLQEILRLEGEEFKTDIEHAYISSNIFRGNDKEEYDHENHT